MVTSSPTAGASAPATTLRHRSPAAGPTKMQQRARQRRQKLSAATQIQQQEQWSDEEKMEDEQESTTSSSSLVPSKYTNRHKFVGFHDRIANIRIDAHKRVERYDSDDDADSVNASLKHASTTPYFFTALQQQSTLDLTADFKQFYQSVRSYCTSLPILLHNKKLVVKTMLEHLQVPNSLAIHSLLTLLPSLLQDLRSELYPQFIAKDGILQTLVKMIDPLDTKLLEQIFNCITYLFKYLQSQILQNFDELYLQAEWYRMIAHRKKYIQRFASEALAYLLRKVQPRELPTTLESLLMLPATYDEQTLAEYQRGVGILLSKCQCGVQHQWHSSMKLMFTSVLHVVCQTDSSEHDLYVHRLQIAEHILHDMLEYSRAQQSQPIFTVLLQQLQTTCQSLATDKVSTQRYHALLHLYTLCLQHRNGQRCAGNEALVLQIADVLYSTETVQSVWQSQQCVDSLFTALSQLYVISRNTNTSVDVDRLQPYLSTLFTTLTSQTNTAATQHSVIQFINTLKANSSSTEDVLQVIQWIGRYVLKYVEHCQSQPRTDGDISLLVLYDLLKQDDDDAELRAMIPLDSYTSKLIQYSPALTQQLISVATSYETSASTSQCANIWLALQLLSAGKVDAETIVAAPTLKAKSKAKTHTKQTLHTRVEAILKQLVATLAIAAASPYSTLTQQLNHVSAASSLAPTRTDALLALWQAYETLSSNTHTQQSLERCLQVMQHHAAHPAVVSAALALAQASTNTVRSSSEKLLPLLLPNVSSPLTTVRQQTVQLLQLVSPTADKLLQKLLTPVAQVMTIVPSFQTEKQYTNLLNRLEVVLQTSSDELTALHAQLLSSALLGMWYIKFSVVWPGVQRVYARLLACTSSKQQLVAVGWQLFSDRLAVYNEKTRLVYNEQQLGGDHHSADLRPIDTTDDDQVNAHFVNSMTISNRSTDATTYNQQQLYTLQQSSAHALLHAHDTYMQQVAAMFVAFMDEQYYILHPLSEAVAVEMQSTAYAPVTSAEAQYKHIVSQHVYIKQGSYRQVKSKLTYLLTTIQLMLNGVDNHKALTSEQYAALHDHCLHLLTYNDSAVQTLALNTLCTYNLPAVIGYKQNLLNVIDDKQLRDELLTINSMLQKQQIHHKHRHYFIVVLIRLLLPKLYNKSKNQSLTHARRAAILSLLAAVDSGELLHLFQYVLLPYRQVLMDVTASQSVTDGPLPLISSYPSQLQSFLQLYDFGQPQCNDTTMQQLQQQAHAVSPGHQLQLLYTTELLIQYLPSHLKSYIAHVNVVLVHMLTNVMQRISEPDAAQGQEMLMDEAAEAKLDAEQDDVAADDDLDAASDADSVASSSKRADTNPRLVYRLILQQLTALFNLFPTCYSVNDSHLQSTLPPYQQCAPVAETVVKVIASAFTASVDQLQKQLNDGVVAVEYNGREIDAVLRLVSSLVTNIDLLPLLEQHPSLLKDAFTLLSLPTLQQSTNDLLMHIITTLLDKRDQAEALQHNVLSEADGSEQKLRRALKHPHRVADSRFQLTDEMKEGVENDDEEMLSGATSDEDDNTANPSLQPNQVVIKRVNMDDTSDLTAEEYRQRTALKAAHSRIDALLQLHAHTFFTHLAANLQQKRRGPVIDEKRAALEHFLLPHSEKVKLQLQQQAQKHWPTQELNVINRMTSYAVANSQQRTADTLAELLLPYLHVTHQQITKSLQISAAEERKATKLQQQSPSAANKAASRDFSKLTILQILNTIVPHMTDVQPLVQPLSKQFFTLQQAMQRQTLAQIFVQIGAALEWPQQVTQILVGLNSLNKKFISTRYLDLDAKLDAYKQLQALVNDSTESSVTVDQLRPVTYIAITDLYTDDLVVRSTAVLYLQALISQYHSSSTYQQIVDQLLYGMLLHALHSDKLTTRKECLQLLSMLARLEQPQYNYLSLVVDQADYTASFIHQINDLQAIERRNILRKLCTTTLSEESLQSSSAEHRMHVVQACEKIILPIIHTFLYNANTEAGAVVDASVIVVTRIAEILPWQPYTRLLRQYIGVIKKRPEAQNVLIRVVCGIVDAFHFDAVDTAATPATAELPPVEDASDDSVVQPEIATAETGTAVEADTSDDSLPQYETPSAEEVLHTLQKQFLPQLQTLLTTGARDKKHDVPILRTAVAIALVKLLQKLPQAVLAKHFPKVLLTLIRQLQSSQQEIRDTTRKVLDTIVQSLGPLYLQYMVVELKRTLVRGYQIHVLGAVVYSMVNGMIESESIKVGEIDYCLPVLNEILLNEVYGEVAAQKQVEAIQNSAREAKASKAPQLYKLLAQCCTFPSATQQLLDPVLDKLHNATTLSAIRQSQTVLDRIVRGLSYNSSVDATDVLKFSYKMVQQSVADGKKDDSDDERDNVNVEQLTPVERQARMRKQHEQTLTLHPHALQPNNNSKAHADNTSSAGTRSAAYTQGLAAIEHFALDLVDTMLFEQHRLPPPTSADIATPATKQLLSMCDPYLPLIMQICNMERYAEEGRGAITTNALIDRCIKVSTAFLQYPLPAIKPFLPKFIPFLFHVLGQCAQNANSSSSVMADSRDSQQNVSTVGTAAHLTGTVFRCLAIVLRHCTSYKLETQQATILLSFIQQQILSRSYHYQALAFTLLRSLLSRKVMSPAVYDMMTTIQQQMIQSTNPTVQRECSGALLQFLMDYPLGNKRIESHLAFLLNNLSYSSPSGRQQLLYLLNALIQKFPVTLIDQQCEVILFPLVLALTNDNDTNVRQKIAQCLRALLQRVSQPKQQQCIRFTFQWLQSSDNRLLQHSAMHVLNLCVDAYGEKLMSQHCNTILQAVGQIIDEVVSVEAIAETRKEVTEDAVQPSVTGGDFVATTDDEAESTAASDVDVDADMAVDDDVSEDVDSTDADGTAKPSSNPHVFLDISVGGAKPDRLTFELFADVVPNTAANFLHLCQGDVKRAKHLPPLHYKSTIIHRLIPGFVMQGGDFDAHNGSGGHSAMGTKNIEDENLSAFQHNERGLLSMANNGPNTGSSQFFITLGKHLHHLDNKHQIFGKIADERSLQLFDKFNSVSTDQDDRPLDMIEIVNCGVIDSTGAPVEATVQQTPEVSPAADDTDTNATWRTLYTCLTTLEKCLSTMSKPTIQYLATGDHETWTHVTRTLLVHPHTWVRTAATRCLGLYLSSLGSPQQLKRIEGTLFQTHQQLFAVARTTISQLGSQYLTTAQADQIIKNLLFLSIVVHTQSAIYSDEQQAKHIIFGDDIDEVEEADESMAADKQTYNRGLHWLFVRMSFTARKDGMERKQACYRWFGAMVTVLSVEALMPHLNALFQPLYRQLRVTQPPTTYDRSFDVDLWHKTRAMAEEVLELVKQKLGHDMFVTAYQSVREQVELQKHQRRIEKSQQLIKNPTTYHKQKEKRHREKKQTNQRKAIARKLGLPISKRKTQPQDLVNDLKRGDLEFLPSVKRTKRK